MSQVPRKIGRVATAPQQREGGGFIVRRPIGSQQTFDTVDPFLLLDHFGPVEYGPGEAVGAPDHPHRGFETVTYILEGGMQHKDSQGNQGNLLSGWVQWMTAGSGVIHSEMPEEGLLKNGGRMEGFQLWVNLPSHQKMIKPRYQDTPPEKIPKGFTDESKKTYISVIAGESHSISANIQTNTDILYLDIHFLESDSTFSQSIPSSFKGIIYVYRGSIVCESSGKEVNFGQVASIGEEGLLLKIRNNINKKRENNNNELEKEATKFLLIAGQPINEPVVKYGPFVMNTEEQIRKAILDFRTGNFGKIDGEDERRKQTEFARNTQQQNGRWDRDKSNIL